MMHAKKWMGLAVAWCTVALWTVWADAQVENVRAQQRARSRVVDVWYDLVSPEGGEFKVSLEIKGGGESLPVSKVSGAVGDRIEPGRNKRIEWDAGADWPGKSGNGFVATVTATRTSEDEGGGGGGSPLVEMVYIPGGTNAGTDPGTKNDGSDAAEYSLTVESFWMDRREVTYGDWKRVYEWAVEHGYDFDNAGSGKGEDHPVHTVNWYDCVKWCNARSEMEGRIPAYTVAGAVYRTGRANPEAAQDGAGYRLPTDDEWEYAARGGQQGRRFPWGDIISHEQANYYASKAGTYAYETNSVTGNHPSYKDGTEPYTAPAESFGASGYGLHDMAGNVGEWTGRVSGSFRGFRGGSWNDRAVNCRCKSSSQKNVGAADDKGGFRAVRRR